MSQRITHPPGPYTVEDLGEDYLTSICFGYDIPGAGSPVVIGFVHHDEPDDCDGPGDISPRQAEAIARLFAASPELLTAAKAVVQADDDQELDSVLINQLRSAIAKAEGKLK